MNAFLTLLARLTSALASISTVTASAWPPSAAIRRAVWPFCGIIQNWSTLNNVLSEYIVWICDKMTHIISNISCKTLTTKHLITQMKNAWLTASAWFTSAFASRSNFTTSAKPLLAARMRAVRPLCCYICGNRREMSYQISVVRFWQASVCIL